MVPQRWRLYIVDLEPRFGTKPGKQRPCLAIQPTEFGEAGVESTVVLPLTTNTIRQDAFPLRVRVPRGDCSVQRTENRTGLETRPRRTPRNSADSQCLSRSCRKRPGGVDKLRKYATGSRSLAVAAL